MDVCSKAGRRDSEGVTAFADDMTTVVANGTRSGRRRLHHRRQTSSNEDEEEDDDFSEAAETMAPSTTRLTAVELASAPGGRAILGLAAEATVAAAVPVAPRRREEDDAREGEVKAKVEMTSDGGENGCVAEAPLREEDDIVKRPLSAVHESASSPVAEVKRGASFSGRVAAASRA